MTKDTMLGSVHKRVLFLFALIAVACLTCAAAVRYATPLNGIPDPEVRRVDSGWFYEDGGGLSPLPQLPCRLDLAGDTLCLVRDLSDTAPRPDDVLAVQTRYQSIRVWADQTLIYEAAQGREHALSSMWHFISSESYSGAAAVRIELTKYDGEPDWELFPILQDHPDAVGMYLFRSHLPTVLAWAWCMLFTLLLALILLFMAIRRIAGIPHVLSLASFIFLSGMWILLDSKISTVYGGNYALTYFFSYCVFYLLPVPLLCYFQLMMELRSPALRRLLWIAVGNAGLWMLLHLLGVISIRDTAVSVHLIIIAFLAVFVREAFKRRRKRQQKRLVCTFWSIPVIFAAALVSIVLYHAGLLPPTNSAVLYIWSLLALILCMVMDTVMMFGRIWKERQYMELYRQLATEDTMTRLANRNAYELRLRELVSRPCGQVTIILFDIDQMKRINDTYGHQAGDQVISLAARCIREVFASCGDCYRIGGDEFCVILTSAQEISRKLQAFDELIGERNRTGFPVSVSYGWEKRDFGEAKAVTPEAIMELKAAADRNLYSNKRGRGQKA